MKSLCAVCFALIFAWAANAQTTAFTYQGKLNDGPAAASGPYLLRFTLWNAVNGGDQIGATLTDVPVTAVNGIFTTQLDFGDAVFADGADIFIEISVRRNVMESYTMLTPRQAVTSAPYAVKARHASTAYDSTRLGGVDASHYIKDDHQALTDFRDPLPGSGSYIQNRTDTQPLSNFSISGEGRANAFSAELQFNIGGDRVLSADASMNTFTGIGAGHSNAGVSNSFFGRNAGRLNSTGKENSFFGTEAGLDNLQGSFNSFFGALAGRSNAGGNSNSFFGTYTGMLNVDGISNSFFGAYSGSQTTSGSSNSFFGASAGFTNQTGASNSFFGYEAGNFNVSGSGNAYFGYESGRMGTTFANNNAFFGAESGRNNTSHSNSFLGYAAGRESTSGFNNVFVGTEAGRQNSSGDGNVFIGRSAGLSNDIGDQNTYVGIYAGVGVSQGLQNTLVGALANMPGGSSLTNATAIGANAVVSQSNSLVLGNDANVGIGTSAPQSKLTVVGLIETTAGGVKFPDGTTQTSAYVANAAILNQTSLQTGNFNISGTGTADIVRANTQFNLGASRFLSAPGVNNVLLGVSAGLLNTGSDNTFIGALGGEDNTSGNNNTFVGARAGLNNTQGNRNIFLGPFAGYSNTTGSQNIAIGMSANAGGVATSNGTTVGFQAGEFNTGSLNSFFGSEAGRSSSGEQNTFIGRSAGSNLSGTGNTTLGVAAGNTAANVSMGTLLGYGANFGASGLSNATAIGAGAIVSTNSTIALGRPDGSDKVRIFGLGAAGSTQLCQNANNEIATCSSSLRYKHNVKQFLGGLEMVSRFKPITFDWYQTGERDLGLGAEDVADVSELLVHRNKNGEVEGVKYDRLTMILLNAVKEQQAQIEALKREIEALKAAKGGPR